MKKSSGRFPVPSEDTLARGGGSLCLDDLLEERRIVRQSLYTVTSSGRILCVFMHSVDIFFHINRCWTIFLGFILEYSPAIIEFIIPFFTVRTTIRSSPSPKRLQKFGGSADGSNPRYSQHLLGPQYEVPRRRRGYYIRLVAVRMILIQNSL
ncbi:hypothetical protein J6590_023999 [Homalodisca vitripennis]|nr:hypothetical protein J6590_023999 [Homalodisca vitripennis]